MAIFMKIIYKRKMLTFFTVCTNGLTATVTFWWNIQLAEIINNVSAGIAPSAIMIVWALITMLAMGMINYAKGYLSGYTCESLTHDLRMGYARHFATLPILEIETLNAGEQLSKLQNEIAGVSVYIRANLFQLLDDGVKFLSTFIWLLFISPKLTLALNLPVFLIVAYVFWSSKAIGAATILSQQANGQMNQYADTLLTLFPIIRLFDASCMALKGYTTAVKVWEYQTIRAERLRAKLMSLSALMSCIPLLLLFLVGGRMTISGALPVGTLYIFLNLSGNVSGVLMNMPGYIGAFRQFSANMKRLEGKICL